jgi:CBS-domain-containing membrane protein
VATAIALGATIVILYQTDHPTLLASLGGSCVILFGMPDSEMARPRSLFGGHLIAGAIGLAFLRLGYDRFGGTMEAWMVAAVATALVAMMATHTIHSPAGANAVVIFLERADWTFMVWPLLVGLLVLFVTAVIETRLTRPAGRPGADFLDGRRRPT